MHPMMLLGFVLLAAVALAPVTYLATRPHVSLVEVGPVKAEPAHGGAVATPNHDPNPVGPMPSPTAEPVATPNHDPSDARPTPSFAMNPVTLQAEPEPTAPPTAVSTAPPTAASAAPPTAASAAPPTAPSTAAFVGADTMLYAKDNARLRAAPNTAADVLAKLAADAPLRAVARSTDGAWWQVSLAGGRVGYVHRAAVTQTRVVTTKPSAAPTPVAAFASPQPVSARRSLGFGVRLPGSVDEAVDWFVDAANRGSAKTVIRTEH
jgi:hypothetical protein